MMRRDGSGTIVVFGVWHVCFGDCVILLSSCLAYMLTVRPLHYSTRGKRRSYRMCDISLYFQERERERAHSSPPSSRAPAPAEQQWFSVD